MKREQSAEEWQRSGLMGSTKQRSFAKSLTWRLLAIFSSFLVVYFMTEDVIFSTKITIITNTINFILYYAHERVWIRVRWGRL
jgi:uncharacterized membrane protein